MGCRAAEGPVVHPIKSCQQVKHFVSILRSFHLVLPTLPIALWRMSPCSATVLVWHLYQPRDIFLFLIFSSFGVKDPNPRYLNLRITEM